MSIESVYWTRTFSRGLSGGGLLNETACWDQISPLCNSCSSFELTLGTCTVLGQSSTHKSLGAVTGYAMFMSFFVVCIWFLVSKRIAWMYASIVTLASIALASILQAEIVSKRPVGACMKDGSVCGMPSGHCIVSYTFLTFVLLMWGRQLYKLGFQPFKEQLLTALGFAQFAFLFSFCLIMFLMPFGRFVIYYHTAPQVGLGCLCGFLFASAWFVTCVYVVNPLLGHRLEQSCFHILDDFTCEPIQQHAFAVQPTTKAVAGGDV